MYLKMIICFLYLGKKCFHLFFIYKNRNSIRDYLMEFVMACEFMDSKFLKCDNFFARI